MAAETYCSNLLQLVIFFFSEFYFSSQGQPACYGNHLGQDLPFHTGGKLSSSSYFLLRSFCVVKQAFFFCSLQT